MLYLRICFDGPGAGKLRNELRLTHREYLKAFLSPGLSVIIRQAGPMCTSDTDESNLGSFMIVESATLEDVQRFHDGDPFTKAGIFRDVRLVRWDRHIENTLEHSS